MIYEKSINIFIGFEKDEEVGTLRKTIFVVQGCTLATVMAVLPLISIDTFQYTVLSPPLLASLVASRGGGIAKMATITEWNICRLFLV